MKWQQLLMEQFLRISKELEKVLDGLTIDDLNKQPAPDCNSIGWLAWHLIRSHDRNMMELAGEEQLWIKDKWHTKFNRLPDPNETGFRHSFKDVAEFKSPDGSTILEYHHAVIERIANFINNNLSESMLGQQSFSPTLQTTSTVGVRLLRVLAEGFQHLGQAAYVRGMLKGAGWRS